MTLALVLSLFSGQVIYEWVDAKGQSHFTDDRSTIPDGVKPKETKGAEVSIVSSPPRAAPTDAGVAQADGEADTGDRSTIPDGVKPKETNGSEVSVVSSPPRNAPATDAGVAQAGGEEEAEDACAPARADLARAEERANAAKADQAKLEEELSTRCGQALLTHGQGSFAQCMAGRSEALTRDHSALQRQVEVARETLRLAEAQGCR